MPKKKVFAARNLKDCLPSLPLETGKAKKKITVFLSRQFCASLKYPGLLDPPFLYMYSLSLSLSQACLFVKETDNS